MCLNNFFLCLDFIAKPKTTAAPATEAPVTEAPGKFFIQEHRGLKYPIFKLSYEQPPPQNLSNFKDGSK